MTVPQHWVYRVDQELPGRSWNIPASDGTALDMTGFTPKLSFEHPDVPNLTLVEWDDNFTTAATFPNVTVSSFATTPPWSALVTAWGKTLPELGTVFRWALRLTRNADSAPWDYEDEYQIDGTVRIKPARTIAT